MSDLVIEKSQRNKDIVYHKGYVYNESWQLKKDISKRFRCRTRSCAAKLTLSLDNNEILQQTEHNHPPDFGRNMAELAKKLIRTKALQSSEPPAAIVQPVLERLGELPQKRTSIKTLKDSVTKMRKKASLDLQTCNASIPLSMCPNTRPDLFVLARNGMLADNTSTLDGMNILGVSDAINNVGAIDNTNNVRAIDNINNVREGDMARVLHQMKMMVPPLRFDAHKGQAGRIAVIGGSEEYTGAPYFAAISALKVGADLVHVFCAKEASSVIKSYSPELIVHPILDRENNAEEMNHWLDRMNAVVIGPGLGRLPSTLQTVKEIIHYIRQKQIPLVVDADGLFLITQEPDIIRGYTKAVLTPNVAEFRRLASALNISSDDDVSSLSKALEGPVVVKKGLTDRIASPTSSLIVNEPGSPRRCGGQGDLLSGALATFLFWAHSRLPMLEDIKMDDSHQSMVAAFAACTFTKNCATRAYIKNGRSTTTSDLISEIHPIFSDMFDNEATKPAV